VAIFAAVLIVSGKGMERQALIHIAILAAFWPPILTGLLVSFACWCARRAIRTELSKPVAAP
jgi:hypothetical protein